MTLTTSPATSLTASATPLDALARLGRSAGRLEVSSSTGFRLPDGSVFSPDASLLRLDRWQALRPEEPRGFAPLCPDLVVDLVGPSVAAGFSEGVEGPRGLNALRRKMAAYQSNGARVGWLLIPQEQAVEVWPASGEPQRLEQAALLEAGADFPGLQLQLAEIWAG